MYAGGLSMPDLQAAASTNAHAGSLSTMRRSNLSVLSRGSPPGFMERFQGLPRRDRGSSPSSSSSSSSSSGGADEHDLLEVENLLESYLMMVDGTLAKLAGIGEYIDDTEDYINIELDYNRNRLLRIEILLTVATFSLAIYNLVAGILGENLVLPESWTADLRGFIIINVTMVTLCATVFGITWQIMVSKKLI
jgi:hypothetical protein